jgi:hypothetical protein
MRDTPKMTRGHFEAIARAIADTRADLPATPTDALDRVTYHLAEMCRSASNLTPNGNRAFDRDRFNRAAGLEDR